MNKWRKLFDRLWVKKPKKRKAAAVSVVFGTLNILLFFFGVLKVPFIPEFFWGSILFSAILFARELWMYYEKENTLGYFIWTEIVFHALPTIPMVCVDARMGLLYIAELLFLRIAFFHTKHPRK